MTRGPMDGAPGIVNTVGCARARFAAMSRTRFFEPSCHGGAMGLDTKRTRSTPYPTPTSAVLPRRSIEALGGATHRARDCAIDRLVLELRQELRVGERTGRAYARGRPAQRPLERLLGYAAKAELDLCRKGQLGIALPLSQPLNGAVEREYVQVTARSFPPSAWVDPLGDDGTRQACRVGPGRAAQDPAGLLTANAGAILHVAELKDVARVLPGSLRHSLKDCHAGPHLHLHTCR